MVASSKVGAQLEYTFYDGINIGDLKAFELSMILVVLHSQDANSFLYQKIGAGFGCSHCVIESTIGSTRATRTKETHYAARIISMKNRRKETYA